MRTLTRILVPLVVAAAVLGVVRPSWACGCGALITSTNSGVDVAAETSIVRYDGSSEEIVMRLSVRSSARDAAWLMPTPSRATVTLGERGWFDQLDRLTAPKVVRRRHWLPDLGGGTRVAGAPAPAGGRVGVLAQQRLGPFEVTTLSAADPRALAAWLTSHGYHLKGRLAQALAPYVARRWTYTAVRLAPRSGPLSGELDPLRIRFAADAPVYPIRLSRLASTPQAVHLYVLAPHRVTVRGLSLFTTYAGRVRPAQVASPGLRSLLGGGAFLTEFVRQGIPPADFTDDLGFTYTADTPYQQVEYEEGGLVTFLGLPAVLWLLAAPAAVLVALVVFLLTRRQRRRARGAVRPVL
ncbi:DUF2330 domain-containing protein [Actinoallomurus rhizosphaericola]|uniref:DUF2330 domain-containing protein n=1 Tax=Actinoallomurus rhizosphaericola TaxID=2952536 RepID=UPI002093DB88|nr:DUF2330 domain-containing protein [Actinoallomurus rhizosphaericola]MCO5999319.1 DUF2330 domain-containing protein [Actinoallomurus rhizosphaericola]